MLERYAGDPRVRLFLRKENASVSTRLNEAIREAKGEFVCFLFSDDYYEPQKLEREIGIFRGLSSEYGVVYGPVGALNELTGRRWTLPTVPVSGDALEPLLRSPERGINMISPLCRRDCFLRYPFHDDVFTEGELILYRVALGYRFHFHPEATTVWRDHGRNEGKAITKNVQQIMVCLDRLETHAEFPRSLLPIAEEFRASVLRNAGWCVLRIGGDVKWARASLLKALRVSPRQFLHPRTVAGLSLSVLPRALRAALNDLADRYRANPENRPLAGQP